MSCGDAERASGAALCSARDGWAATGEHRKENRRGRPVVWTETPFTQGAACGGAHESAALSGQKPEASGPHLAWGVAHLLQNQLNLRHPGH